MGVWQRLGWRTGGAGNPEGGQASSVSAVGDDRGEAGLAVQDGARGRERIIGCPSLDSVPEAVHAPEHGVVRGEEVGSVCEYGEE